MTPYIEFKIKYKLKRTVQEEHYEKCKETFFMAFNWVAVGIVSCFSFFTGVGQTNLASWNMTSYCNNEKFNQIVTPVSTKWAVISTLILAAIALATMSVKMVVLNKISKDFLNIVNFLIGFLLSWNIIYVLQNIFSYPIPSFFQHKKLKEFYCNPPQTASKELQQLDLESRGSFPSYLMCALSYTTTYFFLFICCLDTSKNFAVKILVLVVPSFITCIYAIELWQSHNNHPEDIIFGIVLGILLARFILRDLTKKQSRMQKFKEDFVSVLIAREMELSLDSSRVDNDRSSNEYTINLTPRGTFLGEAAATSEDAPPPYSSLNL